MNWRKVKGWQIGAMIGFIFGLTASIAILSQQITDREPFTISLLILLLITTLFFTGVFSLIGFVISGIKNWKNLETWKKGAIWGILLTPFLFVSGSVILANEITNFFTTIFVILFTWFFWILSSLTECSGGECTGELILNMFLGIPLTGFIIGGLIGYLIGKIKSKIQAEK